LARVFDVCHGCRLCFKLCSSFPTLFAFIDEHDDQDAAALTRAQQDQVVDECFQCKLCYVNCPYTPGQHEWAIDFPRLMLRADAMRVGHHDESFRERVTTNVLGRTDLIGKLATRVSPIANAARAKPGSLLRKVVEKSAGISSQRLLPPFTKTRFSTWFRQRITVSLRRKQARVAIFPTCLVEYQNPAIGQDLVKVYERNGVECSLAGSGCCGAPFLHSGDVDAFTKGAVRNVRALADAVRAGNDIVVPQPTCSYILKKDYVDYVGGADAELVAANTYDASEYLMKVHREDKAGGGDGLDMTFEGTVPETTTYHAPCHLRAQNIGLKSRDLIKLTGTKITLVAECSGIDGTWGLREENFEMSRKVARKMASEITKADSETVAGDCSLANGGIVLETGAQPQHPLSLVARAYGIDPDA